MPSEPAPPEAPVLPPESQPVFPWRSGLALCLALTGQWFLETGIRNAAAGILFYLPALFLAVWGARRGEWVLASPPQPDQRRTDALTVRLLPFLVGGFGGTVCAVAAFLDFGDNRFTWHNLTWWLLAIGFWALAFWQSSSWKRRRRAVPAAPRRPDWGWAALLLAVTALVVFFRVYRLNEVPAEPYSDHAEKILDVYDLSQGQYKIFFERNTGREGLQMYLTLAVARLFKTGLSFLSLKIGTILCGLLTLPYVYLLGKEVGNRRVALLALFLVGVAYWPNVISRSGLRFPLYPLFVAPVLYYLLRGLRNQNRSDFVLAGIFLGLGLHGYSPFRIVPLLVVLGIGIYALHNQPRRSWMQAVIWTGIVATMALMVFLPLLRYAFDNPGQFSYRAMSRLGAVDQPLPGPAWQLFLSNVGKGLLMFNWDDGEIWVHSIPHRPALDLISAALFVLGAALVLTRYLRQRRWLDLFLLLSVPVLQLPSTLSLAFPAENPALNRAAGAYLPAFLLVALALDGLAAALRARTSRRWGPVLANGLLFLLLLWSSFQNFNLVFVQYDRQFREGAWNSSEMGAVIAGFRQEYQTTDTVWIVAYPHWVDTRLPGVWAGIPNRDFAIWPEQIESTLLLAGPKMFLLRPDDAAGLETLQRLYPQGEFQRYASRQPSHDFLIYFVPAQP
ncbi:MAG: glycosyltransferase family 39 protein [Anaerolineales bacterium]